MDTSALKHSRRKEQQRQAAKRAAESEQAQADLITSVRADALRLAVDDPATKSLLPEDIAGPIYDDLTAEQRISILENYIKQMRALGAQMVEKFGASNGVATDKQIKKIERRIDAAAAEIVRISAREIELGFVLDDEELTHAERQHIAA